MSKRRWNLGDMNMWHLAASSLRPRYYVDLHGLSLDECVAKTREMIDVAQDEWLAEYEIALIDIGGDPADHAAAIERRRTEHVRLGQ